MSCSCNKLEKFFSDECLNLDEFLCFNKDKIIANERLMAALFNQYKNYLYKSARKIVNRYPGIEIDELMSEGFEGILRALEKYNCNESSFLTYAQHWVRMKMFSAARKSIGILSLPGSMYPIISKVKAILDESPELSHNEIAYKISESPERVSIAINIVRAPKVGGTESLEDYVTYEDSLNTAREKTIEDDFADKDYQARFWAAVEISVTPKECFVLSLLFGRNGEMRRSLEWVAKVLFVSKERIRQIKAAAFEKLKASDAMKDFINQDGL